MSKSLLKSCISGDTAKVAGVEFGLASETFPSLEKIIIWMDASKEHVEHVSICVEISPHSDKFCLNSN